MLASLFSQSLRVRALIARYYADALSLAIGGAMVGCIVLEELRLRASTYSETSDYWEHAAVLHALIQNPLHPSNPHLLSAVPSPRFGPISVALALLCRALGGDAIFGLKIAAVAFTFAFVLGAWLFFRSYFRDPRAGLYGLLVLLGSWWEAWTFTSVYQPKVLLSVACYPWLAAFGLTLCGLALTLRALRAERVRAWELIGTALWLSTVLLTHQLTAMMALSALCLLIVTEPQISLRRRGIVLAASGVGCLLTLLWPYYSVWQLLAGGQSDAGWVGRGVHTAVTEAVRFVPRHRFYRPHELGAALGLALLTLPCLPYFFLRRRRLFVGLGVLSMITPFSINAFVPLPLGHRFLLLAVFFLQVGVVWIALALTPGSAEFPQFLDRRGLRSACLLLVWAVLGTFAYHNVQRTEAEWAYFERYARRGESSIIRYARSAAEQAGQGAVILGESLPSWPIPTFGAKVVSLHHENPFVADADERNADGDAFLAPRTSDRSRLEIIRRYHATHVIAKREPRGSAAHFLAAHATRVRLPAGYTLFTLAPDVRQ